MTVTALSAMPRSAGFSLQGQRAQRCLTGVLTGEDPAQSVGRSPMRTWSGSPKATARPELARTCFEAQLRGAAYVSDSTRRTRFFTAFGSMRCAGADPSTVTIRVSDSLSA